MTDKLQSLRQQIAKIEGRPLGKTRIHQTGVKVWDEVVGGLPSSGLVTLSGAQGSGKLSLALQVLRAQMRRSRVGGLIDASNTALPSALSSEEAQRLLYITPTTRELGWAVEQVLASGCCSLLVVDIPQDFTVKWQAWRNAAIRGGSTALVLGRTLQAPIPPAFRVTLHRGMLQGLRRTSPWGTS